MMSDSSSSSAVDDEEDVVDGGEGVAQKAATDNMHPLKRAKLTPASLSHGEHQHSDADAVAPATDSAASTVENVKSMLSLTTTARTTATYRQSHLRRLRRALMSETHSQSSSSSSSSSSSLLPALPVIAVQDAVFVAKDGSLQTRDGQRIPVAPPLAKGSAYRYGGVPSKLTPLAALGDIDGTSLAFVDDTEFHDTDFSSSTMATIGAIDAVAGPPHTGQISSYPGVGEEDELEEEREEGQGDEEEDGTSPLEFVTCDTREQWRSVTERALQKSVPDDPLSSHGISQGELSATSRIQLTRRVGGREGDDNNDDDEHDDDDPLLASPDFPIIAEKLLSPVCEEIEVQWAGIRPELIASKCGSYHGSNIPAPVAQAMALSILTHFQDILFKYLHFINYSNPDTRLLNRKRGSGAEATLDFVHMNALRLPQNVVDRVTARLAASDPSRSRLGTLLKTNKPQPTQQQQQQEQRKRRGRRRKRAAAPKPKTLVYKLGKQGEILEDFTEEKALVVTLPPESTAPDQQDIEPA